MTKNNYTIRYLPLFEKDLNDILDYIMYKLNNREAAKKLLNKVEKEILKRSKNPLAFEKYTSRKFRKNPYYKIKIGNYLIFMLFLMILWK